MANSFDPKQLMDFFDNIDKGHDHALWLNFKYRIAKISFGVIHGPDDNFAVVEEATAQEMEMSFIPNLPKDYCSMSYDHIRHIKMDEDPLRHWESLNGTFAIMDGELLRFILAGKIPLEKFIRAELAARGYDKDHRWCGFEKAEEIWLVEDDTTI